MKALVLLLLAAIAGSVHAGDGKALFAANCSACHQVAGTGISGAFPALKGNTFVQGEADKVIATVLTGRGGMPSFAQTLDDAQLADVLSYVRSAWGNRADAVEVAQVEAVRVTAKAQAAARKEKATIIH